MKRSGIKLLQQATQHVTVTNSFVSTGEFLCKSWSLQHNFVATTSLTNSCRFDFVTCCSNKMLLQSQISSQKFSSIHEAICCPNACHLVCSDHVPLQQFFCNVSFWSSNIGDNCCSVSIYHCRSKKRNISSQKKRYFSHAYLNIEKEHYFCGKVLSTKNLLLGSPQGSRTRNFPWLVWACPPGYFHRKHRGTKTKRILQLFKS